MLIIVQTIAIYFVATGTFQTKKKSITPSKCKFPVSSISTNGLSKYQKNNDVFHSKLANNLPQIKFQYLQ
jgi:hypothetical protein